jgi:hypothetical protein
MAKKNFIRMALLVTVLGGASAVMAQHNLHAWQKVSEQNGVNGLKVCTWTCRTVGQGIGGSHSTTTSGYGACPSP